MMVLDKDLIVKSEKTAVESGAFSYKKLMKNAGNSACEIIKDRFSVRNKKIVVICGNGNNAGDGFVIANALSSFGADVTVVKALGEPKTENALYYYKQLKNVTITDVFPFDENFDIYIDAIFGIGLNREPNKDIISLIEHCNNSSGIKVSVDIPSGVECDSGKVFSSAFKADLTITFIALKPCFVLPEGSNYCGETVVADIGITPCEYKYLTNEKPVFKERLHNSHKGTYGTALLICGKYGMAGAAILSAKAALRSGVGIAKCILCKSIYPLFTQSIPEAVCIPFKETLKGNIKFSKKMLKSALSHTSAILIGCGIGMSKDGKKIIKYLLENENKPIVIDADGINNLYRNIELLKKSKAKIILTPHPGEMAKLINSTVEDVESNRIEIAKEFSAKYNCILVLKGANTIIAEPNGNITFNTTGNPGMSTGGSGDVLAGIIVSLLAQGHSPLFSAKAAVYLHSNAGDKASVEFGQMGMIPSDIIKKL